MENHAAYCWASSQMALMTGVADRRPTRDVIALADIDDPGETVARDSARRRKIDSCRAHIAFPPERMDFNDLPMVRAPRREESAP